MNSRARMRLLPDGRRLHLNDGPIDLILEALGNPDEIKKSYRAACSRFVTVLDDLCGELSFLRQACCAEANWPRGAIARRMTAATLPYATEYFVTPMASVAGAVAEEILAAMVGASQLSRAYVNNGGDIALYLTANERFVVGMVERPDRPSLFGATALSFSDPVRGLATSGWRGRSFSLGIADAVTVLADRAAAADAAATIIANAVNLPEHPAVVRTPACDLAPDSDLGDLLVTQDVGELTSSEVDQALGSGTRTALKLLKIGLIRSAALRLQGETRVVGRPMSEISADPIHERSLVHA